MGNYNSGRRPKPTSLKVLRGITRRDRLNPLEPIPVTGEVVKPTGLSVGGSAVWDELAPICLAMKTLTVADVRPFATLCELQATMQATSAAKSDKALFTVQPESAEDPTVMTVMIDSVLKLERETAAGLRPYYELFGLTPVSRARIMVPKTKPEEPASKWAGVLS